MQTIQLSPGQQERLARLGVGLVYLFGSHAERTASPLSDVDVGVVMRRLPRDTSELYQQLYELLTDAFPGQRMDLVFLQRASLELRGDAVRHGTVLYEASPDERAVFEERTMLACADFAPVLREIDRAILART